jgi:hypothetical protein
LRATSGTTTTALSRVITMRFWLPAYLFFAAVVCWTCYRQPIAGEFDRWMYDAVVRTNLGQSIDHVFEVVKHSSPRIEQSTAVASPGHLGIIEPMFAIKAIYIEVISLMAKAGIPIEKSISLVSVVGMFAIAMIIGLWTRNPVLSALLVMSPACVELGRSGTPDALSAAVVLGGLWAVASDRVFLGLSLLLISVWVRTDNVLLVLTVIVWLLWSARLRLYQASVVATLAVASVFAINHFSANYGWLVLFRCSFLLCKPPLDNLPRLTLREYFSVFVPNLETLAPRAALWLLLGLAAWRINRRWRQLLSIIAITAVGHFLLFPSPEERTLIWAFLAAGIAFVLSLRNSELSPAFA